MTPRHNFPISKMELERVDSIPVVLTILMQMGVQAIIDALYTPHGNHQGLSVGWLATIFLDIALIIRFNQVKESPEIEIPGSFYASEKSPLR